MVIKGKKITIYCRGCGKILISVVRNENLPLRLQISSPLRCSKCNCVVMID